MSCPINELINRLNRGQADTGLIQLSGKTGIDVQKKRYLKLLDEGKKHVSGDQFILVSAPGRTELGGNHTDHNNGRVLASAVDLDCLALATPTDDLSVTLFSAEYSEPIRVELEQLTAQPEEQGTPHALIRGVAAARRNQGRSIGGFSAVVHSTCTPGTGLSSSAAFSVLVGGIFAFLYEGMVSDPVQLAHDARTAENKFFGKPCGLMDQLSSSVGSTLGIDFQNPDKPDITRITAAFDSSGYQLVIIDTGGSHIALTPDYSSIPAEIEMCTKVLGKDKARGLSPDDLLNNIDKLRDVAGDRAVLRLMHFICEDQRAALQVRALQDNNFTYFLELVKQSGESSCKLLQNCASSTNTREQGILLARSLSDHYFPEAVCRVHGGGFAGTVQAYIANESFAAYRQFMEQIFGRDAVIPIRIGRPGICSFAEHGWIVPGTQD